MDGDESRYRTEFFQHFFMRAEWGFKTRSNQFREPMQFRGHRGHIKSVQPFQREHHRLPMKIMRPEFNLDPIPASGSNLQVGGL